MTEEELYRLRFPKGEFVKPIQYSSSEISHWIAIIASFPKQIEELISNLDESSFEWQYRPNGWNIRQVVNHCADSHMNAFIRFKLTLTEDTPTIRPYFENRWAEQVDYSIENVGDSIAILRGVHSRWVTLMNSLNDTEVKRSYYHPEAQTHFTLAQAIANYAWHCTHHLAHINQAIEFQFPIETL